MKVSHEAPLMLMEYVSQFNDYSYCLPHLLDSNEKYRDFFIKAKEKGEYIIMDNSLHELGTAYKTDRLLYWLNELEPNEFIVPDVWENPWKTLELAEEWIDIKISDNITKVAVIQATEADDFSYHYVLYQSLGYKKIALSYGLSVYNKIFPHPDQLLGKMLGRVSVISDLVNRKIINEEDRIHLLGCALPTEFVYYQEDIPQIESIDTSNPVMAAIEGTEYGLWKYGDLGINHKPKANMNNSFEEKFVNMDLLESNLENFRYMNNL